MEIFFKKFFIQHSFLARDSGGLLTFVHKNVFKFSKDLTPFEFSKGRIMRTEFFNNQGQHFVIYNSHIYKINSAVAGFKASVLKDSETSSADPKFIVFLSGDFKVNRDG